MLRDLITDADSILAVPVVNAVGSVEVNVEVGGAQRKDWEEALLDGQSEAQVRVLPDGPNDLLRLVMQALDPDFDLHATQKGIYLDQTVAQKAYWKSASKLTSAPGTETCLIFSLARSFNARCTRKGLGIRWKTASDFRVAARLVLQREELLKNRGVLAPLSAGQKQDANFLNRLFK
jgi:hypothetical protein